MQFDESTEGVERTRGTSMLGGPDLVATSCVPQAHRRQWSLSELPSTRLFSTCDDDDEARLLRALESSSVSWGSDTEDVNLPNLLASFIMFANESCAHACAEVIEELAGPICSDIEVAALVRYMAPQSGKLSIVVWAINLVHGEPLHIRDMLAAARAGHARLTAEICNALPLDICMDNLEFNFAHEFFDTVVHFLNWTSDTDVGPLIKEVGCVLGRLPSVNVHLLYQEMHGFMPWANVEALRHITAYWPCPHVFLHKLIPNLEENPEPVLNIIGQGLFVNKLRAAWVCLEADVASDRQRSIIKLELGLKLPQSISSVMPIIIDFL